MKKLSKMLCFVLAALLLSSCLFACGKKPSGEEGGNTTDGSSENDGSSDKKDDLGKDNVVNVGDLLGGLE